MKIYLDNCCYGRPFDNHDIPKTKAEAEAIESIIEICKEAGIKIIGSTAIESEIGEINDPRRPWLREAVERHYNETINDSIILTDDDDTRAQALQAYNIGVMDSYHLTAAEAAGADFLLTTDPKFEKRVRRHSLSVVQVENPITFLPEVIKWLQ